MSKELLEEWKEIAKKIKKYDKKYAHGIPLISDFSYDALKQRLEDIEKIIGKQRNSPLNTIGEVEEKTVDHATPMLSLDHGYGANSISDFYKKIYNATKSTYEKAVPKMIIEHKIDGVAVSIRYENGAIKYVLTRGDGFAGIDITKQSKYIKGIPQNISLKDFDIRGEIYMTFEDFDKTQGFKSPRNATTGIIRSKEMDFIASHNLQFIAHGFVNKGNFEQYSEGIEFIKNAGFQISDYHISKSEQESIEIFEKFDRDSVPYPIDGMVFKINDLNLCEQLGHHRTAPRYAFAAKFPPKNTKTFIKNIEFQVGKFGTITPVAEVNSIEIDGVMIQKVSMHNMAELQNKKYNIGDEIIIARAGDVIPYILSKESSGEKSFELPNQCPVCNFKLIWDSVTMRCTNGWNCNAQALLRIEHFVSRKAMNISGLGAKNIEKLFNADIVKKPNDIFNIINLVLNNDEVIKKLLGTKVAQNTFESIQKNKKLSLSRFIYCLCIPNIGHGMAKTIATHCITFDNFINIFQSDQIEIKGVGPMIIESIKKFISEEKWIYDAYQKIEII
ncbi:NAD-dependent DNA ligase LigA [Candidatus Cytomitobacter indipagum]|uniref:DNA ligase (NAD(+)) n=1 Tax=Candidatus Cytomitobacter indipagum TaxID=2601575 RepID=A0A5C0UE97_9PROT|nr:NAD-dependent DNA ligase LigA [Candidatus Cytomitobacter indipagum]QEK38079.1 NAD-dependent DNA ligase LigA [Candidatus Cytomitobacter indipagum]